MFLLGQIKHKKEWARWHESIYMQILELCAALQQKKIVPDAIVYEKNLPSEIKSFFQQHIKQVFGREIPGRLLEKGEKLHEKTLYLLNDGTFQQVAQGLIGDTATFKAPFNVNLWQFSNGKMKRILPVPQSVAKAYQRREIIELDRPSVLSKYEGREEDSLLMQAAKEGAIDVKTGLPNFRMYQHLKQSLAQQKKDICPGTLLLMDIDNFGKLNEQYGYDQADLVIRQVGRTVQKGVRKSDIVGRFGGDEIVIYCQNATPTQVKDIIAPRLQRILRSQKNTQMPEFTVSFGVSDVCMGNFPIAMAEANAAIRVAKMAKDTITIFDQTNSEMCHRKTEYMMQRYGQGLRLTNSKNIL